MREEGLRELKKMWSVECGAWRVKRRFPPNTSDSRFQIPRLFQPRNFSRIDPHHGFGHPSSVIRLIPDSRFPNSRFSDYPLTTRYRNLLLPLSYYYPVCFIPDKELYMKIYNFTFGTKAPTKTVILRKTFTSPFPC